MHTRIFSLARSRRFAVLREGRFRAFLIGNFASDLGAGITTIALVFAVLDNTGSTNDLGLVLAARIVPMVLFLLGGGVLGDRFPRRYVMIYADGVRASSQAALAIAFLVGTPGLWLILVLAALNGLGEAAFRPSFDGLAPLLVRPTLLADANAMLGFSHSVGNVAGPALAGVLVIVLSPATILLLSAMGYVPSIVVLLFLRLDDSRFAFSSSLLGDLREGWRNFWSYRWLWTITIQFTLFNLLVWAPYLVLGPVSADRFYGGAGPWGLVVATYGGGAALGGLLIMGRRPWRPLVVATVATFGWAAPSAALALRAPLAAVCVAALVAGIVTAIFNALFMTTVQQHVPREALSRVMSYVSFGAYSIGPVGLALAGPISNATSISAVLAVGVAWQVVATSAVLAVPAVRHLRRIDHEPADEPSALGATPAAKPHTDQRA
jgi:MFS family permease